MTPTLPRQAIQDFAHALEETATINDFKSCWTTVNRHDLLDLLREELRELHAELLMNPEGECLRIQLEARDVALCALMIWDQARGPACSVNRGRQ